MGDPPESMDDQEREVARLLEEDTAATSELHDARVLAAVRKSAQRIQDRESDQSTSSATPRPWTMALAASVVAAMLVVYVAPWDGFEDDVVRSSDPGGEVYPASESTLEAPPDYFSWPEQPAASRYELTLRDNTGASIWTVTSDNAEIALEPAVGSALVPNVSYIWSVRTEGSGPNRELGPYWFQISD